jgi:hypothetical protein
MEGVPINQGPQPRGRFLLLTMADSYLQSLLPRPITPSQRLYALSIDITTEVDTPAKGRGEFDQAPEGWAWGERVPRRPGLYLWRYTLKWEPWFRRVVELPSGELGAWSHRYVQAIPLSWLVGKSGSSLWLLPTNQRIPK